MLRVESFSEDFYRKPLEVLLELAPDAQPVLAQLETTLQSYRSLMEKLEVDISFIWQERDNMIELLFDYLHEVHDNLGQIDRSSTITIREKPVKMLKLILPDWEENEGIYRMRLKDYVRIHVSGYMRDDQTGKKFFMCIFFCSPFVILYSIKLKRYPHHYERKTACRTGCAGRQGRPGESGAAVL